MTATTTALFAAVTVTTVSTVLAGRSAPRGRRASTRFTAYTIFVSLFIFYRLAIVRWRYQLFRHYGACSSSNAHIEVDEGDHQNNSLSLIERNLAANTCLISQPRLTPLPYIRNNNNSRNPMSAFNR